jgi:hypothetical protein
VKQLADFVEQHTVPGLLARILKLDRFDTNQRHRLRVDCEHHGAQVPTHDFRCPKCMPAGDERVVVFVNLPTSYVDYLRDPDID